MPSPSPPPSSDRRGRSPPAASPPRASPPRSPPRSPRATDAVVPPSVYNPFLQPLDGAVDGPLFPTSPIHPANLLTVANGSPPLSGSASPPAPAPPAPPSQSPELAFSNEHILSMIRPLVRVLQDRRVLDPIPHPAPASHPNFPPPSVGPVTGSGTSRVPHSLTTKHEGFMGPSNYMAITMKPALQNKSLEELRLEDYELIKILHPFSAASNPLFEPPSCSGTASFRDPPQVPNTDLSNGFPAANPAGPPLSKPAFSSFLPTATALDPASNMLKLPWLQPHAPSNAPSFDHHSFISPFSMPSSCQPTFHQPNSQTLAKSNNSNTYATNWLRNDAPLTGPTSFKPRDNQSTLVNPPNPLSFPAANQPVQNGVPSSIGHLPIHNSFVPNSQLSAKGDPNGAAAADRVVNHDSNGLGANGFSQTVSHTQSFTTPAGRVHGPVFNEIRVSQTSYYPQGWHC